VAAADLVAAASAAVVAVADLVTSLQTHTFLRRF
jgi:hypothetical protein